MDVLKKLGTQRILAVLALIAAIGAAFGSGDLLAYIGIAFYLLCIAALFMKHPQAHLLLWTAVGVHTILVSFSLWRWQALGVTPCHFCFLAAGSALVAAVVYYQPRLALVPLGLMLAVGFSWSALFGSNEANSPLQPAIEAAGSMAPADSAINTQPAPQPGSDTANPAESTPVVSADKAASPARPAIQKPVAASVLPSKPAADISAEPVVPVTSSPTKEPEPAQEPAAQPNDKSAAEILKEKIDQLPDG